MLAICGTIWLVVGASLLRLGLNFLANQPEVHPQSLQVLTWLKGFLSHGNAIVLLIATGLFIGYFKGRYVLGKSVENETTRIKSLPNPSPAQHIYSKRSYIIIGMMMGLGILMRFVPIDIRGLVDVAVGAALINGSILYFKKAAKA